MIQAAYGVTEKPITSRNPQANFILEMVHQTIGNIIRIFKVQDMVLNDDNPLDGILASTMFALSATVHTTTQYTPAQLIFGRDSILYTRQEADWQIFEKRKQDLFNKGNQQKNRNKREHTYNKGDKVILKDAWKTEFNQDAYLGPYTITVGSNNGTVRACNSYITDSFNICKSNSYKE